MGCSSSTQESLGELIRQFQPRILSANQGHNRYHLFGPQVKEFLPTPKRSATTHRRPNDTVQKQYNQLLASMPLNLNVCLGPPVLQGASLSCLPLLLLSSAGVAQRRTVPFFAWSLLESVGLTDIQLQPDSAGV